MALLDGELTPDERAAFEREMAQNPELQADFATHRALADFVKSNADCLYPASLDSLADDVVKALPVARASRVVGKRPRVSPLVVPVAVALAMAAGLGIFYGTRPPAPLAQSSAPSTASTDTVITPSSSLVTANSESEGPRVEMALQPSDVEDLDVNDSSASILIYTVEGRRSPVIWIHDQNETKGL
jgi:anti-sigma factor RsiW